MTHVIAAYEIEQAKRRRKDEWIESVVALLEDLMFEKPSPLTDYIDDLLEEAKGGFEE